LEAIKRFIENPFKSQYEELVKVAASQISNKFISKKNQIKVAKEKLREKQKRDSLKSKLKGFETAITKGANLEPNEILEKANELFNELVQIQKSGGPKLNVIRELLLPLEDTNIVASALTKGKFRDEVYSALKRGEIDYCNRLTSNES